MRRSQTQLKIRDERGYWGKENTLLVAPANWLVSWKYLTYSSFDVINNFESFNKCNTSCESRHGSESFVVGVTNTSCESRHGSESFVVGFTNTIFANRFKYHICLFPGISVAAISPVPFFLMVNLFTPLLYCIWYYRMLR